MNVWFDLIAVPPASTYVPVALYLGLDVPPGIPPGGAPGAAAALDAAVALLAPCDALDPHATTPKATAANGTAIFKLDACRLMDPPRSLRFPASISVSPRSVAQS